MALVRLSPDLVTCSRMDRSNTASLFDREARRERLVLNIYYCYAALHYCAGCC